MTSPIIHARSSVRRLGGDIERHALIHQALDDSKIAYCDARHRAVFHHVEGLDYIVDRFCTDEGDRLHLQTVGIQHLREDMGGAIPSACEWAELLDLRKCPKIIENAFIKASDWVVKRYGGEPTEYRDVFDWLTEPNEWSDIESCGLFRHHSYACFDLERHFGKEILCKSTSKQIPTRYIGENWIRAAYGVVPTLADWCAALPLKSWMNKGYSL